MRPFLPRNKKLINARTLDLNHISIRPKDTYNTIYQASEAPAFLHPSYLDLLVGPENWDVVLATSKSGRHIAAFPFTYANLRHWQCILPVSFVPYLSLVYAPQAISNRQKISRFEKKAWEAILKNLPKKKVTLFKLPPNYVHPIFQWRGCDVRMAHTNVLKLNNNGKIWENLKGSLRSDIRYAQRHAHIEKNNVDAFLLVYKHGIKQKNIDQLLAPEKLRTIIENQKWVQFDCWTASIHDEVVAGILIMRDHKTDYYLLSSNIPKPFRGANALLLWNAIEAAVNRGVKYFDFEGSQIPSIQHYFSAFNPVITPYKRVYLFKNKWTRFMFQALKGI